MKTPPPTKKGWWWRELKSLIDPPVCDNFGLPVARFLGLDDLPVGHALGQQAVNRAGAHPALLLRPRVNLVFAFRREVQNGQHVIKFVGRGIHLLEFLGVQGLVYGEQRGLPADPDGRDSREETQAGEYRDLQT